MKTFAERIDEIVASQRWGSPSAAKRGRNPQWPYVPVIAFEERRYRDGFERARTEQIRGLAFATRAEAVERAAQHIEFRKATFREQFSKPNYRAHRSYWGMPCDLAEAQAMQYSDDAVYPDRAGRRVP